MNSDLLAASTPNARNHMLAILTLSFANMVLRDREPSALDEQTAALRAVSVLGGMPGDIPDIRVLQTFGVSNRLGSFQGFDWRGRQVFQQVQRMKAREVYRNVSSQIGFDPPHKIAKFAIAVIQGWN